MIKAYFFDFFRTLGIADGDVKDIVTKLEHYNLLTGNFENANISKLYQEKVLSKLSGVNFHLYEDSEKVIKKLKENGYKLAIVSNIYDISAKKIREQFPEFFEQFNILTFSAEVGMKKPNPQMFFYTLGRLNQICNSKIAFGEVVMIGDQQDKDIEPALNWGMEARLIDRTKQSLEDVI